MNKQYKKPVRTGEKALTEAQVDKLLSKVGRLDHEVLLRIAIELGLRRGDVVAIEQSNVNLENRTLLFNEHKKGGAIHKVWLSESLSKLIEQYLYTLPSTKWLFPGVWNNGKNHMADKAAYNILAHYLKKAGLPPKPFHALRATCVKIAQRHGWSIEEVMKLTNDTFRTIKEHYDTPSDEEMFETTTGKPLIE